MADTIFSALCHEAAKEDETGIGELVGWAEKGGLRISDVLPFIGETLYIPKPAVRIQVEQEGDSVIKKQFKQLKYIPIDRVEAYLQGKLDPTEENQRLKQLGYEEVRTLAADRNKEEPEPFFLGTYRFREGSGLYFLAGFETETIRRRFEDLMQGISYSGIGGKRSAGLGKFRFEGLPFSETALKRKTGNEKTYITLLGTIHYWIHMIDADIATLVFLPGLTADHRLFEKQIEYFQGKYNVFVWDAPAHAASWPFQFDFDLFDKVKWLNGIFKQENITRPVIVGQSMGGYVGQAYAELYPENLKGFVSIDSAPLQRKYVTGMELWLLKRMEPVYFYYPWKSLLKSGTNGVAVSEYGRKLMYEIMMVYDGDKKRYSQIAGHGFKILANAMEASLPYEIKCPALLICGEQDHAGSCIRYNKAWHKNTGIPLEWIKGAGHNSNTDKPEIVNRLIERVVKQIQ